MNLILNLVRHQQRKDNRNPLKFQIQIQLPAVGGTFWVHTGPELHFGSRDWAASVLPSEDGVPSTSSRHKRWRHRGRVQH